MPDALSKSDHRAFSAFGQAAHDQLRKQLSAVRAASNRVDRERCWTYFEEHLLAHLRAEEELLLPSFELAHHHDAARLRAQHNRMRELLVMIGVAADGGREALAELVTLLEHNHRLEERSLFCWAQQRLSPRNRGEFCERTRASAGRASVHQIV